MRTAPLLAWRSATGARFYNLQVFRSGRKILSVWPKRPRYKLRTTWKFAGRKYRLRRGPYTWVVWPARGTLRSPRYGKALGQSTFRYVGPLGRAGALGVAQAANGPEA